MDRRQTADRRDAPRGGRRQTDRPLSTRELVALARREELISADVLRLALGVSRRALLREWASRQLPMTVVGRRVWLASDLLAWVSRAPQR